MDFQDESGQQQIMYVPQEEYYYEDYENEESAYENKKHYKKVSQGDILNKIEQDLKNIQAKTVLERHWSILLFDTCRWKIQEVDNLIVQDQSNFKELINYKPGYKIEEIQNYQCEICCNQKVSLKNSCGHTACIQCWKSILQVSFESKVVIPKCFDIKCTHKINALLIEFVLSDPQYQYLKPKYNRELVAAYCQTNYQFKVCPNPKCQTEFLIDLAISKPIECFCGAQICTMCGKYFHFPAECHEVDKWQKLASAKENQDIKALFFKKCPKCNTPIEKNEGCNHMTCKCTYQFCWRCLSKWQNHDYCYGIEAHEKLLSLHNKILKQKKEDDNLYYEYQRLEALKKRMTSGDLSKERHQLSVLCKVNPDQFSYLGELFYIINTSLEYCKCFLIYKFFKTKKQFKPIFEAYFKKIYDSIDKIDDYMSALQKKLEKHHKSPTENQDQQFLEPELRRKYKQTICGLKEYLNKILEL